MLSNLVQLKNHRVPPAISHPVLIDQATFDPAKLSEWKLHLLASLQRLAHFAEDKVQNRHRLPPGTAAILELFHQIHPTLALSLAPHAAVPLRFSTLTVKTLTKL